MSELFQETLCIVLSLWTGDMLFYVFISGNPWKCEQGPARPGCSFIWGSQGWGSDRPWVPGSATEICGLELGFLVVSCMSVWTEHLAASCECTRHSLSQLVDTWTPHELIWMFHQYTKITWGHLNVSIVQTTRGDNSDVKQGLFVWYFWDWTTEGRNM